MSGTYGGTRTLTATLTSGGDPVVGELVDIHLGSSDLGTMTTDVNGVATFNNVSLGAFNVGTYTGAISASFDGDSNFAASSGSANLTVTPAPLTITANNQTKVYGAALPTLNASYTGFVNGDTAASLTTQPTLTTTATAASHVAGSPYAITASGAVDPNYTISYVAGSLTRHRRPADDHGRQPDQGLRRRPADADRPLHRVRQRRHRGQPDHAAHAHDHGHRGQPRRGQPLRHHGQRRGRHRLHDQLRRRQPDRHRGPADDHGEQPDQGLRRRPADADGLVHRVRQRRHRGQPDHRAHAHDHGHRRQPRRGQPLRHHRQRRGRHRLHDQLRRRQPDRHRGPADDHGGQPDQGLRRRAADADGLYTGFVNGDTSASLTTPPTLTTTATAASHVAGSPYAITASGAVDTDYTISYVAGSLTVTPAPLTITADNQTKVYGAALPTLTASYTGFVNGDTSASLTTPPTLTTTATAASHVAGSPYAITASGAVDTDYTISYVAGSLTVTPLPVSGTVYMDLNANGTLDSGEPGMAGRVVFLDLNANGKFDSGEPSTTTDVNGNFTLGDPTGGDAAVLEDPSQDSSYRDVVDQTATVGGQVTIGVVPVSPIAPVPVVPSPFTPGPNADAPAAYAQALYHAVLGRDGSPSEVSYWVNQMSGGMTRQQVSTRLHQLNRAPDDGGQLVLHAVPAQGARRLGDDLLRQRADGRGLGDHRGRGVPEFARVPGGERGPATFVADLYDDVLSRHGDPVGAGLLGEQADGRDEPPGRREVVRRVGRGPDEPGGQRLLRLPAPADRLARLGLGALPPDARQDPRRPGVQHPRRR